MSFFEFPYTRTYDKDLGWIISEVKRIQEIVDTFVYASTLKFADPILWNITTQYEKSTIVLDPSGNAYLSKDAVPSGIQLNNTDYWLEIFNFTEYTRTANQNLTVNVETNTTRATAAYQIDDWLIWNDVLYKVTNAIAIDDILIVAPTEGANIIHFTVEDFIKAFMTWATNTINQYKDDIDTSELAYQSAMQAQVDRILAGATVDSEVIDARLGANGINYSTLGNAIRGQVSDHTNDIRRETSVNDYYDLSGVTFVDGYYIANDGVTIDAIGAAKYCDYIEIPDGVESVTVCRSFITRDGNITNRSRMVFWYDENKNFISTGASNKIANDLITSYKPSGAKYIRVNFSAFHVNNFIKINYEPCNPPQELGFVGSYTLAFTGIESITTDIVLKPNTTYMIKALNLHSEVIHFYGLGNTNSYKRLYSYYDECNFTNDGTERYLCAYTPENVAQTVTIAVYEFASPLSKTINEPKIYKVSKNAFNGDYTSLSRCFLELQNDATPKIIIISAGEYDIYSEYVDLYNAGLLNIYTGTRPSMEYFDYCVWVPDNTKVIGIGKVVLKWMPDPSVDSITPMQCQCISPLNVAGSAVIENIEVLCKNGRYCLHNDAMGKKEYWGSKQIYKNVKFYKYVDDTDSVSGEKFGFSSATGYAVDRFMEHEYINCYFEHEGTGRAFYGHARTENITNILQSPTILLNDCIFKTQSTSMCIKLGNPGSFRKLNIPTIFNNCYFDAPVKSLRESDNTQQCANAYNIRFLNCGNVSLEIKDNDNPYTPEAFNTNMTVL